MIAAKIVVLIEDADLRVRFLRQDIFRIDPALRRVARNPEHGPGIALGIDQAAGAADLEELRHLLAVEIAPYRFAGRRAERPEDRQHAVLFDQLARLLDSLGRAVA